MFRDDKAYSIVTAILPNATAGRVIEGTVEPNGGTALAWKARGTLLRDHWLSRWMPPISPVKTVLQMVVPQSQVDGIVAAIMESGRLHQQATGAVFSTPCDHAYVGSEFQSWPESNESVAGKHDVSESLSVILCSVGQAFSDRVARAAVEAGAHGPVIYFTEGRGLRDRVGWLRIAKEPLQEVQMVVADEAQVDDVFDAMAKAGGFNKPGRGLMYRMNIDKGMFNLPSSFVKHRHEANMQQIIKAIDHLNGHTHWRDQSVFALGDQGRIVGVEGFSAQGSGALDRVALTGIVRREQLERLTDLIIDSGATGLNMTFGRFVGEAHCEKSGARIHDEHCIVRSIIPPAIAARICAVVDDTAEELGIRDLCMLVNPIQRTATYVPGRVDHRAEDEQAAA